MKARRGFTLIEMMASTILLAVIVIGVMALSRSIGMQKTTTENTVYLSLHNLECMERLRQMAATVGQIPSQTLANSYDDSEFGSLDIETNIYVETANYEHFYVYRVTVRSKMREFPQRLTSHYVMTSIGSAYYDEVVNSPLEGEGDGDEDTPL